MTNYLEKWNNSYENKDNFVFTPHEEIVRFVSKHIRKRIGINEFTDIVDQDKSRDLDFGCGIGRHIIYGLEMGLDMYGFDLSNVAIKKSKEWAKERKLYISSEKLIATDATSLPWEDSFFQYSISHAVLDSMNFNTARIGCKELNRVLCKDALFYCDLISGDNSRHDTDYAGEEVVETKHEFNTIQNYYNYEKIKSLFKDLFKIEDITLIRKTNIQTSDFISRYHLVLSKI